MEPKPRCPTCGQEMNVLPPDVKALLDQLDRESAEDEMCRDRRH